ncbi:MAG TPA: hypothetical protein VK190_13120 [Pseudoneobacillus sp.]|nr:hypothetical protein [Pseudoneobacillus sp.]
MKAYETVLSIHPDKNPISLIATQEGIGGISYQVRVNFEKKRFASLEWKSNRNGQPFSNINLAKPGSLDVFKREIYSMNLWDWKPCYQKETGIILGGTYWSVKLKTKGKIYESEGTEYYPPNWDKFCQEVEKLTGTPFR